MAANELTLLRFYGPADGELPHLRPADLTSMCAALSDVFAQAVAHIDSRRAEVVFIFALPPRRGCLEFVFQHLPTIILAPEVKPPTWDTNLAALGLSGAAFLYNVVFGGRGIVDLMLRGEHSRMPGGSISDVDSIRIDLCTRALESGRVATAVRSLVTTAAETGARKIEIIVSDEEPVVLYSEDDRRTTAVLVRALSIPPASLSVRQIVGGPGPRIPGSLDGKPVTVFLGRRDAKGPALVVIWLSKVPPPDPGVVLQTQGRPAGRDDVVGLSLEAPMPVEFEDTDGIVIVNAVATYS